MIGWFQVREVCEIIGAGIQPLQNVSVIMRVDSENASKRIEWAKFWIEKGFAGEWIPLIPPNYFFKLYNNWIILIISLLSALEKLLSTTSGKYCVGDELTLADCFLVPQAAQATR